MAFFKHIPVRFRCGRVCNPTCRKHQQKDETAQHLESDACHAEGGGENAPGKGEGRASRVCSPANSGRIGEFQSCAHTNKNVR